MVVLFAFCFIFENEWLFFGLSMFFRVFVGFAQGFINNSTMSVGAFKFPNERESYLASCQLLDFFGVFLGMIFVIGFASFLELPGILIV